MQQAELFIPPQSVCQHIICSIDTAPRLISMDTTWQYLKNTGGQTQRWLLQNEKIIIQNSDKGNLVVILNKTDYLARIWELLSNTTNFRKLTIAEGKDYN